jgi:hypothetical protein
VSTVMALQRIKQLFGFFNLTDFEKDLIAFLKAQLPPNFSEILDSQLVRFNKVDRVLEPADQLPFGHTSFYWTRFGRARFDFPRKFPSKIKSEELATLEVYCPEDDNVIKVTFVLVHGFLFTIKYRSDRKVFAPRGRYTFRNFRLMLKY